MPETFASSPHQQHLDIGGHIADDSRYLPVAVDAEPILAEDLHYVGHLIEKHTQNRIFHGLDYTPGSAEQKR